MQAQMKVTLEDLGKMILCIFNSWPLNAHLQCSLEQTQSYKWNNTILYL